MGNKVNGACGCPQGPTGPDACNETKHPEASYFNKVPPDYTETCNGESPNVKKCWCQEYNGQKPADGTGHQCFFKGVAFDTTKGEDSQDETNIMMDWRVDHTGNDTGTTYGPALLTWNEFVFDGNRVNEALRADPAGTIVATVWSGYQAKTVAQKMAQQMQEKYKLSAPLPVIMLDHEVNTQEASKSPVWVYRTEDQPASVEIV